MLRKALSLFLFAALAATLAGPPCANAQGIGKLLESLTGSKTTAPEKKDAPPSEQLEWARTRLADAKKSAEEVASPDFSAQVDAAGAPPETAAEFQKLAGEIVRSWEGAITLVESVVLGSQIAPRPDQPPAPPQSPEEAARLEADLVSMRAAAANSLKENEVLLREQSSNSALRTSAEAAVWDARQALDGATPENRTALSIALRLAEMRLAAVDARGFYLAWAMNRSETEQKQASDAVLAISTALDESPYNRLLDARRLSALAREAETARPALEERLAKAVADHDKTAEALRALKEKNSAGGNADSRTGDQQRAAMELLRRKESLRLGSQLLVEINSIQQKEWNSLLRAVNTNTIESWREVRGEIESDIRQIEMYRPRVDARISEVRSNLDSYDREMQAAGISAARKSEIGRLREAATSQLGMLIELQSSLSSLRTTQDRLLVEIESRIAEKGFAEKLAMQWTHAVGLLGAFWNYPLTITEGRPITTGKIILAVLGFVLGVVFARLAATHSARALHLRFRLQEGQSHVVQSLLFYGLVAAFFLTTLSWLAIPLTVFAFLGGALMVGIGFGSQNLMNNFISGLIILLERKVNVGDLVEVDGHLGRIASLGARCSSVRKFDGVEVLVPNSFLLEKNVVNWTLSDPDHRFDFTIGVAYGSDPARVRELLLRALKEPPEVLAEPPPEVFFEAFGDSALIFHLYFWLRIGHGSGPEVGSRIRMRIETLLRENNIALPFPQRDVNLHVDPATIQSLLPRG